MKITVFTHAEHVTVFQELLDVISSERATPIQCNFYDNYDDFIYGFPEKATHKVIVARRGADGMESARAARLLCPTAPLIWLSDDNGFGIESYRIGCTFFSAEPLTLQLLKRAIDI